MAHARMYITTGTRRAEVAELRVSHGPGENDLDMDFARVRGKGGRDRSSPLTLARSRRSTDTHAAAPVTPAGRRTAWRPCPDFPLRITPGGPAACLIEPRPAAGGPTVRADRRRLSDRAWRGLGGRTRPTGRPGNGAGPVRVPCVLRERHLQGPCKGF
jgi:hypothetical protein